MLSVSPGRDAHAIRFLLPFALAGCVGDITGRGAGGAPAPTAADRAADPNDAPAAAGPAGTAPAAGPAGTAPAGAGSGAGGSAAAPTSTSGAAPGACGAPARRLVRLSASQYDNTARALLGAGPRVSDGFSAATKASGGGSAGLGLGPTAAADFFEAGRMLARRAAAEPAKLDPCLGAQVPDMGCVRKVVTGFGQRAFRRPLADEEVARLAALFTRASAMAAGPAGVAAGVDVLVRAVLVSPHFLLRPELGTGATGPTTLAAFERASALSYTLADGPPDEPLLAAAESGALMRREAVTEHARRLLAQSGAPGVMRFLDEHLGTPAAAGAVKEGAYATQYTADVASDLVEETRAFLRDVLWSSDGRFSTALQATDSVLNERLARYYGIPGVTGSAFRKVALPAGQRVGLLTHGSVLARFAAPAETDPILRGKFVREVILCQKLPEPPPNVPPIPPRKSSVTQRQRLEAHRADPACSGCHRLIDPLGLPFEAYDAAGRFRTTEAGRPVVTTGELSGTAAHDGPVVDALDLARRLAAAPEPAECLAKAAFAFVHARDGVPADGGCGMAALLQKARATGGDLRALLMELVTADAFFARQ